MSFADLIESADSAARAHLGGVSVVYQPAVGDAVTVDGLFDNFFVLADEGTGSVEQVVIAVWLHLADLPVHPDEDDPTLTIDGVDYRIRQRQPDGMGSIRLLLHKAL